MNQKTRPVSILNLSGGGTKGIFSLGVSKSLAKKGYKFNYISGISIGAVLAMVVGMGTEKMDRAASVFLNVKLKDFFDEVPITKKGNISLVAIKNVISSFFRPVPYLGKQNLRKLIAKVYTEKEYLDYINSPYTPEIVIGASNLSYGSIDTFFIKREKPSFEKYLKIISASSHIPISTQPVTIEDNIYYDGGITDHIIAAQLTRYVSDIKKEYIQGVINIFTRPDYLGHHSSNHFFKRDIKLRNIIDVAQYVLPLMIKEVSINDQMACDTFCLSKKIPYHNFFGENYLNNAYDTDPRRLADAFKKGLDSGFEFKLPHVFYR